MSYKGVIYCNKCFEHSGTHSIRIIKDGTIPILYTKIAEAKEYDDTNGILQHYRNLLRLIGNREWIWIFDCNDLEFTHCFEIGTSRGILLPTEPKTHKFVFGFSLQKDRPKIY